MITLVVQVNGKVRDRLQVPASITEAEAKERVLASQGAQRYLNGQTPQKVLYYTGSAGEYCDVILHPESSLFTS